MLNGIKNRIARFKRTRVNSDKGQGTNKRISRDLKSQRSKGRIVIRFTRRRSVIAIIENTLDRLHFQRRGQQFDNRIQHRLNALVFKGRTDQDRNDLVGQSSGTKTRLDILDRQLTIGEVLVHQLIVCFSRCFDHQLAHLLGVIE